MKLIFSHIKEPNIFAPKGWNGTDIACKQRTGQSNLKLSTEITVNLPDKIDARWYTILQGKLIGVALNSFKHTIKVLDNSPNLLEGYKKLYKEQNYNYTVLSINPMAENFTNTIGKAILELKREAKAKLNGY